MKNTIVMMWLIATFGIFTSPANAAISKTHEINFDGMVPCVQEIVHLQGPFRVSLTFAGKSLTNTEVSVHGIRGTGESSRRTYSADQNNVMVSSNYTVRSGVGSGHLTVTFQVIGRLEGNSGNLVRFWAKQIVRLQFGKNLNLDFESLKVCATP
ncbi:MAG: hypothetical protein DME80_03860 [Verrucomicrobia bacterium]|nr:MAG: hypothetical protein DME80_03860 [Verrucomicrobiota bacterium]